MFVRQSTYEKEMHRRMNAELELAKFIAKWNVVIDKINARGGEEFLYSEPQNDLNLKEINKLINLCHPDKHNGKKLAEEMTGKLIELKNRIN